MADTDPGLTLFPYGRHFSPLVFFPLETFTIIVFSLTLPGQYIIKNIVLMLGGIVIGATVKCGRLTAKPEQTSLTRKLIPEPVISGESKRSRKILAKPPARRICYKFEC